jgi:hypothetical protein
MAAALQHQNDLTGQLWLLQSWASLEICSTAMICLSGSGHHLQSGRIRITAERVALRLAAQTPTRAA